MKQLYLLLCLFTMLTASVQADSINTIQLQNRPAEEVIPIVKPMLGPNDSVSGQGFQLFLRSSPETLAQVKQMISNLDVAAKMLQISVFQGNDRDLRALSLSGNVQVQSGDANVSIGTNRNKDRNAGGGDVSYSTRNASAGASTISTRGRLQDNPIHQLRVTEGTEGYIETGEQIPYFSGASWWGPEAVVGVDYKDVTTGFYVLPRIHGDQVTMHVSPFKQSQSKTRGGDINTQSAKTTITGRMGEWLPIGGTTEQTRRSQSSTGSYTSTQSRNNESIWIKADLVQ
jgi:type II secretory pathway component GspD/PulD (secretin)